MSLLAGVRGSRTDAAELPRSPLSAWQEALRLSALLWGVAVAFAIIAVARSATLDIPFRDPDGTILRNRLTTAAELAALAILGDSLVRAVLARRAGRGAWATVRARWNAPRLFLVASGLLGYHAVYFCYRNLKSWDTFNTPRDTDLLAFDKALFLGHHPAVLLHDLLGRDTAADVLAFVYRSFTYLIVAAVVGCLVLSPRIRQSYLMLYAATWAWIIGLAGYYLVPSLGPFASAAQEFTGLRETAITATQGKYLLERAQMLQDPSAAGAFQSISAFPSLHVGVTTTVLLVAWFYGLRSVTALLGIFLTGTVLATIYFGWHFVSDDIAGVALAIASVTLSRWFLAGFGSLRWDAVTAVDEGQPTA